MEERKPIDPQQLYPRLYSDRGHEIYRRDLGRHMQLAGLSKGEEVSIPMLEDLHVRFVQGNAKESSPVSLTDQGAEPEWTDVALIQQAFRNLRDHAGADLQVQQLDNGLYRVLAGGWLESSFLLLSNLWMELQAEHGAELYAAVPTHKLLVFGRVDDRDAIQQLQVIVRGVFAEESQANLLSKAIYRRWDEQWEIVATAF